MSQTSLFDLQGKIAVVTGGGGVLGGAIAEGLAAAGATVAVCDLLPDMADACASRIRQSGGTARGYALNVFNSATIVRCSDEVLSEFGGVDILVNAVGGNMKGATTAPEQSFFDISAEALNKVIDLNLVGGTILPSQIFGKSMIANPGGGSIINISSMNAFRPLTRIPGYSAAKAAVSNFTQWLAVHLAQEYNAALRVNAIAPGFFLTEQNRFLLTDKDSGGLTDRGRTILEHTPLGRFGSPGDLIGAAVWLAGDASRFVTGIVLPVDGGFSAFSGV
ncbi:MAG TPA: SDR family oxidoreductase [Candidatus Hydrogenedentes bacterium]|jgi:NAD(P)-dependent dehydrogenase (short-subunit alcohol dehydrogenase family)|nr:MAG: putative oxidoreductase [Candidatus Hydrogenedentes bacterium ADurb.Bin170]HNZ49441.1 SDR family oxidoreductase [Candidatus Hydrogenedentota bacterium]HOM47413.1 SDR family oxidoreductase [Candidatus Hydrogenedentota bacterium]HPX86235.1 SDR family oxidoreductase [Candidatus Hydrogenedentota bacterium]